MAEKPTRKTPAKRGPTKAAALKTLGLTQEDLNVLESLHEGVEAAKQFSGPHAETSAIEAVAPEGKLSGTAEVTSNPTVYPPEGYQFTTSSPEVLAPVEPVVQEFYIRNLRHMDFRFRLQRQEKVGERATTLKPRGQRGDMAKLEKDDFQDANLQTNMAYGILEVITAAEAIDIMTKQYTNVQAVHSPLALLRNEKGEAYHPDAIRVDPEYNSQGVKVADLKPVTSEYGEIVVNRGGIQRETPQNSAPAGGNPAIVSDGFVQTTPQLGAVDQAAIQKDALARSKEFEGPGAGVGNVTVTVEPVRKS